MNSVILLVPFLQKAMNGGKIEAPESGAWKDSKEYAEALYSDPVLDEAFDTFAMHSYWSNRSHKREFAEWFSEHYPDKTISMTEFCQMEPLHNPGIDGGLHLANVIHEDMTIGSVITWQWWLAIATGGYADGLIYAHPRTHKIEVTKRLWVMAHYARFLPHGSVRIDADASDDDLQITAYLTPDEAKVVCVVTNHTEEIKRLSTRITGHESAKPIKYWLTTEGLDLAERSADSGSVEVPARSIATIVTRIKR